jgi:hypothetical protein
LILSAEKSELNFAPAVNYRQRIDASQPVDAQAIDRALVTYLLQNERVDVRSNPVSGVA